jgi:hypothetical protein
MKTILAAAFAVMIGLSFAGSTFADEKKMDAAPAGDTMKESKTETKTETKSDNKNGKKHKKTKKTTKTEEKEKTQ